MKLALEFRENTKRFSIASFSESNQCFDTSLEDAVVVKVTEEVEYYTGSYDVTPQVNAQSLETKDKFLTDDVRIHEIPYFDVGNTSGGSTVYIGTLEELIGTTAILGTAKLGIMKL